MQEATGKISIVYFSIDCQHVVVILKPIDTEERRLVEKLEIKY